MPFVSGLLFELDKERWFGWMITAITISIIIVISITVITVLCHGFQQGSAAKIPRFILSI